MTGGKDDLSPRSTAPPSPGAFYWDATLRAWRIPGAQASRISAHGDVRAAHTIPSACGWMSPCPHLPVPSLRAGECPTRGLVPPDPAESQRGSGTTPTEQGEPEVGNEARRVLTCGRCL